MTASEYLADLARCVKDLRISEQRISAMREGRWGMSMGRHPVGPTTDKVAESVCRIVEQEEILDRRRQELREQIQEGAIVIERVGAMYSQEHAYILEARYLDGKSWRAIANELGICQASATKIHRDAIKFMDDVGLAHLKHGYDMPKLPDDK